MRPHFRTDHELGHRREEELNIPRFTFLEHPNASPLLLIRPSVGLYQSALRSRFIVSINRGRRRRCVNDGLGHHPRQTEPGIGRSKASDETCVIFRIMNPHQVIVRGFGQAQYPKRLPKVKMLDDLAGASIAGISTVERVVELRRMTESNRHRVEYVQTFWSKILIQNGGGTP